MGVHCGIAISARNEGERIRRTLNSIRDQTISTYTVVVNDGSIDDTGEIARELADEVYDLPFHKDSYVAKPELAASFNIAFKALKKVKPKYIMVSGGDVYYPPEYIEKISNAMKRDNITIASGLVEGEEWVSQPRGGGRIYEGIWFENAGYSYPVTYGFESALLNRALSDEKQISCYNISFKARATKKGKRKVESQGASMKSLNYWWPYAILRCINTMFKDSLSEGIIMLRGFLFTKSYVCEDLKKYMYKTQKEEIRNILMRNLFRGKKKKKDWLREV